MRKHIMKYMKVALLGLAVFSISSVAFAQEEQGITPTTIKLGVHSPLSGDAMAYGFDVVNAAKMYYNKVNKEGGIHGRQLVLAIEDDRCNANDTVAAIKKLNEQERVFLLNGGSCSGAVIAVKEYVERNKIPFFMLNASGDPILYPPNEHIFGAFSISQHAVGGSMVAFATDYLKGKKIAYINHNDAYGASNFVTAEYMANRAGVQLTVQSVSANITDVTAPLMKIKAANADVLLILTYARPAALIMKKAVEIGFKGPMVLGLTGTADLRQLIENVDNKEAFNNFYVQDCLAEAPGTPERSGPKLKWVYDLYKQSYPDLAAKPGHPTSYMPYGVASAMTVVQALKLAGPNPTRKKVIDATTNMKFDTGIMASPVEFSPNDHAAQESAIYLKLDASGNTKLVPGSYKNLWTYTGK